MLSMMPGSLLDKTNINLSNIACLHLNITKNIGPEKEYRMDATHACDLSSASAETEVNIAVMTEVNNLLTEERAVSTVPASNLTSDSSSSVESSSNTQEKTHTKRNTKTKLWKEQLSKVKRQTREMQNKIRVLSSKLKRYYFKQGKLNWVKCPIRIKNTTAKGTQKSKKKVIKNINDTKELAIESEQGNDNKMPENDNKMTEANKTNILLPIIPSFKADDDIRNKIKQQLELLRTNRKVSSRNNENEIDETNMLSEISEDNKTFSENNTDVTSSIESSANSNSTNCVKPVKANLSEVLLSNEGELSIVSVVGGYVSDEEMREESTKTDNDENIHYYTSSVGKGTSMTDILLQRDFSANQDDSLAPHLITPKKTKDITKIKGWKSKQFLVANSLFQTVTDVNSSEEYESEPMETVVMCTEREILTNTSPDDPVPSTSTGILGSDSIKEGSKLQNAHILPEADNILKQGEDAQSENNSKSAFVSDVLDTFLSNHAELKISYEVPKLKAEEAITKPMSEMPVTGQDYLVLDQSKTNSKSKYHKKNMVKPKTLAEKRRMLELDRQNQLLQDMSVNEAIYLKKLEYCEKRDKTNIAKDVRESLINAHTPFSRYCWIMATKCDEQAKQFAVVNGDKIRINGSCGGQSLIINDAYRNSDSCNNTTSADVSKSVKGCILNRFSKPSLIGTDQRKSGLKRPVQYKPGPLSKKRKLLKNLHPKENWECHVLKMPTIKLVLYPEEGKRIPVIAEKYLQLCRSENGYISDEWAKFAVSAVRSETNMKTKVEFELPYANRQNKLIVRKRSFKDIRSECGTSAQVRNEIKFPDVNVEDTIKDVMSDMLDCIDNQQLDKNVIRKDPDLRDRYKTNAEDIHCRPPSPINSMVKAIIKRPTAKKSKTTMELRRLNVQVIEVDVKVDETENINCTNDFCRLGCICKSLRGPTGIVPEHCGRVECMLECKCTFGVSQRVHHSITLPAGTDLLSASTVVRLQDEAKRNLAKEERKFTQTVIKANNQTIMVGGGTRERQRRVPKVPKKYSNYVQKSNKSLSYMEMISNGLLEDEQDPDFKLNKYQMQKTQTTPKTAGGNTPGIIELKKLVPIWKKEENAKSSIEMAKLCRVRIDKLQLENVTPWCMVHNLYKCHCGGKAVLESNAAAKSKNEQEQNEVNKTINEEIPIANEYISYASRFTNRYQSETGSSLPATEVTDKYSARTRALATNFYQARNKSQNFKARYAKIKEEEDKKSAKFAQSSEMLNKRQVNNPDDYSVYEVKDDDDDDDTYITYAVESEPVKTKLRTDVTYVDVDEIINSKDETIQLQDSNSETGNKSCHLLSSPSFIDYDRSFVGLLIPSEEWFKRLRRMMKLSDNGKSQIRLLEWATLVKRQKCGTIQMWFKNKKYNNIFLTEDRRRPSRNHMNIKMFENTPLDKFKVPDIISSIFSNTLPGKASKATDTYVILVFDGSHWEARGTIVLSASLEMYHTRLAHRPTPVSLLTPNLEYKLSSSKTYSSVKSKEKPTESNNQSLVIRSTPSMSVEVVNNQLPASPPPVQPNKKGIEITKVIVEKETPKPASIMAALPNAFKHKRWFTLFLENDFSVLRIADTDFHIKYTHLNTAMQMAKTNGRTVRIRSQGSKMPNARDNFGIYVVENFGDRLFFGPYANGTGHGLETFRYVNSKLVNTKIYNKMRGTMPKNTCGQWYVHTSTVNHKLHLVPETEDNDSSGSECCTEVTSPENAVKPRIEFVDLTANDSDSEDKTDKGQVDPIFNVLSADFSRKVSSDVTIEPVGAKKKVPAFTSINNHKSSDIVIQQLPNRNSVIIETKKSTLPTDMNRLDRKRKLIGDSSQEPAKKQPTIIDSINLDLDDEEDSNPEPVQKQVSNKTVANTSSVNNSRLMPELHPTNETQTSKKEISASKTTQVKIQNVSYVITNIPGVGYFEIIRYDSKYHIQMNIENKSIPAFLSIQSAITWLELLFHKNVYFMPVNLKMQFSNLQSTDVPDMPKFKEMYLNGFHMICEKGIFDLLRMNNNDLTNLGFSQSDFSLLLAHKCELLIKRDVKILGRMLFQPDELRKMDRDTILKMAPLKVKSYETAEKHLLGEKKKLWVAQQNLLCNINARIKTVSASVKNTVKQNIVALFNKIPAVKMIEKNSSQDADIQQKTVGNVGDKTYKLPVGKVCKIVNGKVIMTDKQIVAVSKDLPIAKKLPASNGQTNAMKSYSTSPAATGNTENNFEMLVPIAGLQTPVTVVGMSSVPQKTPSAPSMLYSNHTISPKVVDLTDD